MVISFSRMKIIIIFIAFLCSLIVGCIWFMISLTDESSLDFVKRAIGFVLKLKEYVKK